MKKAWKLYDLKSNEFFASRDVVFLEDQFPGIPDTTYVTPPVYQPDAADDEWLFPPTPILSEPTITTSPETPSDTTVPVITNPSPPVAQTAVDTTIPLTPDTTCTIPSPPSSPVVPPTTTSITTTDAPPSPGLPELLGRGHRNPKPSVLKDYVC